MAAVAVLVVTGVLSVARTPVVVLPPKTKVL
jgi:hypothetical protein